MHTFAVYNSLPLHVQFPLPGMLSLHLHGKVLVILQILAYIALPRKDSLPYPNAPPTSSCPVLSVACLLGAALFTLLCEQ